MSDRAHTVFHVAKSGLCSHNLSFCVHKNDMVIVRNGTVWQQMVLFILKGDLHMKNIFVEGIQGSGKSTLVNHISKWYPGLHVCREGDYSPVELAWCAWMNGQEYEAILKKYDLIRDEIIKNTVREQENYIITYTRINTDIPGFYKDLENYEIYNGRKTLTELKEIISARFQNFSDTRYLFECSFFQNIIEDLILFHMLSDEEIMAFYGELFESVDKSKFMLLYLYADNPEENIKTIQKERCDDAGNEVWYQMMLEYMADSPYGREYGCSTFDDLIHHLKHRQRLELSIIKNVIGENAVILPAQKYDIKQLTSVIGFPDKISYNIRHMRGKETALLDDFLYEAIFIPEGATAPPKEIINKPELQVYVRDFGMQEDDICFVAEVDGNIVGAVWVRVMDDYGHVEDGVPSFAISLYKEYRGLGIGTAMMKRMLGELKSRGYKKASLAVQKANYAVKMYQNVGFKTVAENDEEYIMVCVLNS